MKQYCAASTRRSLLGADKTDKREMNELGGELAPERAIRIFATRPEFAATTRAPGRISKPEVGPSGPRASERAGEIIVRAD